MTPVEDPAIVFASAQLILHLGTAAVAFPARPDMLYWRKIGDLEGHGSVISSLLGESRKKFVGKKTPVVNLITHKHDVGSVVKRLSFGRFISNFGHQKSPSGFNLPWHLFLNVSSGVHCYDVVGAEVATLLIARSSRSFVFHVMTLRDGTLYTSVIHFCQHRATTMNHPTEVALTSRFDQPASLRLFGRPLSKSVKAHVRRLRLRRILSLNIVYQSHQFVWIAVRR
ncbi:hypothetical protein TNCV_1398681 [Trichonephila clavipes]|nr:hypothetical protein TNCV_1398681 [Trichonephila clavipes]